MSQPTIMSATPASIQDMYPPVPVSLLVSDEWQRRFDEYFVQSGEFESDPFQVVERIERSHRKCVSVSLFKQSVDNRVPQEFPVNEGAWRAKYWNGLMRVAAEMPLLPDWKLRIYVERDLADETAADLSDHPQVELYCMRTNSVGGSPGMLWRLMALADHSLDVALVTDIDEALSEKLVYMQSFEMDARSSIGRIGGLVSDRGFLVAPNQSHVKNYTTILGSRVMSRCRRFDFDIADAMRGFMAFRKHCASSDRPWAYAGDERESVYNQPIGAHIYGWGSHWYMYGFDERFLKHVLYYHFAEKGEVHTWTVSLPPSQLDLEGLRDLEYVRSIGNTTVLPHNMVRLAPLNPSQDAFRIAALLDEHRWIFDSLLQLMRRHSGAGICGNLFFHDIENPYFIELIPKQLNLFQTARRASKALEIGFNAGHSTAIMLLANSNLTVRAFDNCALHYTRPCLQFLNSILNDRITLVEGDSRLTLAADGESGFDLVHIDADHTYEAVAADLAASLPKCADGAIVVMDDYEPLNDVARATHEREDLRPADTATIARVLPGSSHAMFRYCASGVAQRLA